MFCPQLRPKYAEKKDLYIVLGKKKEIQANIEEEEEDDLKTFKIKKRQTVAEEIRCSYGFITLPMRS